jgi:hypothetical protein
MNDVVDLDCCWVSFAEKLKEAKPSFGSRSARGKPWMADRVFPHDPRCHHIFQWLDLGLNPYGHIGLSLFGVIW